MTTPASSVGAPASDALEEPSPPAQAGGDGWSPLARVSLALLALLALAALGVYALALVPEGSAAMREGETSASALTAPSAAEAAHAAVAPRPAASSSSSAAVPSSSAASSSPGLTADGKVVLNRASAVELRKLPRIGARRAEEIVKLRERLGGFKRPQDLLRVKGIGRRSLVKLMPHFVLGEYVRP